MPPKPASDLKPEYAAGEKILCFHGPLLYEAKCLDVKIDDNVLYFVHYQGWNKSWDEWVKDSRMAKYNEAGLKKQKELEKYFKSGKKLKALRKSDLKNQVYPPPEALEQLEKIDKVKSECASSAGSMKSSDDEAESDANSTISEESSHAASEKQSASPNRTGPGPAVVPASASGPAAGSALFVSPDLQQLSAGGGATPVGQSGPGRRRKVRAVGGDHPGVELEEGILRKPQLRLDFPEALRLWMVDDWDLVTRQSRLYHLPPRVSAQSVLDQFSATWHQHQQQAAPHTNAGEGEGTVTSQEDQQQLYQELAGGLARYFNLVLGSQLLYRFERLQYADVVRQHGSDKRMTECYGPIYLLRLLVKLRDMMAFTRVDGATLPTLETLIHQFLAFLDQHKEHFFQLEDYDVATAEYQRRAMC